MTHHIASTDTTAHRVTITCACGHECWHPTTGGAQERHAAHLRIVESRDALEAGKRRA